MRYNEVVFLLNVYYNVYLLNNKRNIFKKRNLKLVNIILSLKGKNKKQLFLYVFCDKNKIFYICYILYFVIFINIDGYSL